MYYRYDGEETSGGYGIVESYTKDDADFVSIEEYKRVLNELQDICEHDWDFRGEDNNTARFVCRNCDKEDIVEGDV